MTLLCTNYRACPKYRESYAGKLDACSSCDGDIRGHRLFSNIADRQVDKLVARVDHNTPKTMHQDVVKACRAYINECAEHGFEVSFPEAAFALQLRCLHTINDLREAMLRGHG